MGRRRFQDLLTPGGKIYHETHFAPLLRMQRAVRGIALDVVGADGRALPALVNATMKVGDDEQPVGILATVFDAGERKEYERELLRARRREQAARERTEHLQRITELLAVASTPEDVARVTAAEIAAGTGAQHVALALSEPGGAAEVGAGVGGEALAGLAVQVASGAAGIVGPGEAIFSQAPERHAETLGGAHAAGAPAALAVLGLTARERGCDVLCLGFEDPREFDRADREFMLACARQCTQALERARLLAETLSDARRAEFLGDASRALAEVRTVAERARRVVELLVPEFADAASLRAPGAATLAEGYRDTAAKAALADANRTVALALKAAGRPAGSLVLVPAKEQPPAARQLLFLQDFAARCALAIENARLYEQERDAARTLQRSLLAGELPRHERFVIATSYRPGVHELEVGGDWYDALPIGEGVVAVAVGDVVGRGLEAATTMGQLRSAIRALAAAERGPARMLDDLDLFVEPLEPARGATVAYAEIEPATGIMRYSCAGHPPPLLLDDRGARYLLDGRSPPLGANLTGRSRAEAQVTLRPGSRLLLYTDGLVERRGEMIDVGLERLARHFARGRDTPLGELVEELADALHETDGHPDDVCVLCFALAPGLTAGAASRS